jgi:hypothetical protein
MAKTCKLCESGTWECGEATEICADTPDAAPTWTKLGTIQYDVFVAHVKGECVVKIEPV